MISSRVNHQLCNDVLKADYDFLIDCYSLHVKTRRTKTVKLNLKTC